MALALIAATPSLKSLWDRSLMLLSRTRRRLILLLLDTSTCISDAPCILYLSISMAIAILTIESMSCRRNPTILPRMDNFRPSLNFRTFATIPSYEAGIRCNACPSSLRYLHTYAIIPNYDAQISGDPIDNLPTRRICKTRKIQFFLRKGKTVILVKNLEIFLDLG